MFKRFSLVFLMVFAFCNLALSVNNFTYSQNIQHGQLNKINLNDDKTFKADILGSGMEQTFKVTTTHTPDDTLTIYQQNTFLKTFTNLIRNIGGGNWYIAYLRNNNIPDIIYYDVGGTASFINDFKIIGKTKNGSIDILFDFRDFYEGYGRASRELFINDTQLIIRQFGVDKTIIYWDGNDFKIRNLPTPDNIDTRGSWQFSESIASDGRSVELSVRDKNGVLNRRGLYDASFIVYAPNGKNYYYTKQGNGNNWAGSFFPKDYNAPVVSGNYSWQCYVNGIVVVSGSFSLQ